MLHKMNNNMCRTCLLPYNDEMVSIYEIKCINNEDVAISDMISLCVGLEISKHDNFTHFICKSCVDNLTVAFNYRKTCWESHINLLQQAAEHGNHAEEDNQIFEFVNCTKEEVIMERNRNTEKHDTTFIAVASKQRQDTVAINKPPDRPATTDHPVPVSNNQSNAAPQQSQKLSDHAEIVLDKTCYLGKRYICRTCNLFVMRRDKIIDHLRIAHGIIISIPHGNTCKVCFKIFEAPSSLRKHEEIVHSGNSFICDLCGATLKNKSTFVQHQLIHTGEKPFKCKFCDYRSAHIGTIISHQRRLHTGETPFLCNVCGEGFISASRRSQHTNSKHSVAQFDCVVCQKQFKSSSSYKKHIVIHDLTKYVPCDVCNKKFATRFNMITHRKQHTGEKNHTCNVCGKGFIQRHSWRSHMKNHHNETVV